MKYQITKEELDKITKLIFELNCPAPAWEAYKEMVSKFPKIEEVTEEPKK